MEGSTPEIELEQFPSSKFDFPLLPRTSTGFSSMTETRVEQVGSKLVSAP